MNKGMIGYMVVFAGLILASLAFANTDQITPNIAQAQGEMTVGTNGFLLLEKGASLILKLLAGAVISSVVGVVLMAAWKRYQRWERDERSRRWNPGPNARWQQGGSSSRTPGLKREDLMLLALMNGRMPNNGINSRLGANRAPVQEDQSIDLEF